MPRDGSLRFLGYQPNTIFDMWVECAENIAGSGGIVVLLTHCEARFSGNPAMINIYRRFLEYVASSDTFAWSSPQEVLEIFLQSEGTFSKEGMT